MHMELRAQFTDDEWRNLVSLPYAISMAVIVAAPSVLGAWGEVNYPHLTEGACHRGLETARLQLNLCEG